MKKTFVILVATMLSAFLFTQCQKNDPDEVYNAGFYTSKPDGKLFLYLDGVNKGALPYFASAPTCGQTFNEIQTPLSIQLKSGEYKIVGKDSLGNIISSGTLEMSKSTFGGHGDLGGQTADRNGDCVMVGLY